MKKIIGYVQPHMLNQVTLALMDIPDFPGMSVSDCEGFGREYTGVGHEYKPFFPKKRIEIFVSDHLASTVFDALMRAAHTGHHGDGKVYMLEALHGGRISTGEVGPDLT